jgi:hypothetical protein
MIIDRFGDGERTVRRVHARERGYYWRSMYRHALMTYWAQREPVTIWSW